MPETGIGFVPDIGASYFLSRCPGETGMYLALTGARIGLGDALALGLMTHACRRGRSRALIARLAEGEAPDEAIAAFARKPRRRRRWPQHRAPHRHAFSPRHRWKRSWSGWTATAAISRPTRRDHPRGRSPTSLKLVFRWLRRGQRLDLERMSQNGIPPGVARVVTAHDFREGVRAALMDKDGKPQWQPSVAGARQRCGCCGLFRALGHARTEPC